MRGNARTLGPLRSPAHGEGGKVGHFQAVIGENLFRHPLIARKDEAARVAAGIGLLAKLEIGHDVLVEMTDAGKLLKEIEDNVGLVRIDRASNCGEVIRHTN